MPIYEYQCQRCEHRLETLQGMNDAPLETCPVCGEPALVKLISAAAFRLKGGGWYETDFKNPKKPEPGGADKPKDAKSKTKSEAKPDSKSDTKPASGGAESAS